MAVCVRLHLSSPVSNSIFFISYKIWSPVFVWMVICVLPWVSQYFDSFLRDFTLSRLQNNILVVSDTFLITKQSNPNPLSLSTRYVGKHTKHYSDCSRVVMQIMKVLQFFAYIHILTIHSKSVVHSWHLHEENRVFTGSQKIHTPDGFPQSKHKRNYPCDTCALDWGIVTQHYAMAWAKIIALRTLVVIKRFRIRMDQHKYHWRLK